MSDAALQAPLLMQIMELSLFSTVLRSRQHKIGQQQQPSS